MGELSALLQDSLRNLQASFSVMSWGFYTQGNSLGYFRMGSHWESIPLEFVVFSEKYRRAWDTLFLSPSVFWILEEWVPSAGDHPQLNQALLMFINLQLQEDYLLSPISGYQESLKKVKWGVIVLQRLRKKLMIDQILVMLSYKEREVLH